MSIVRLFLVVSVLLLFPASAGRADDVVHGELGRRLDAYMTRLAGLGFTGGLVVSVDGEVAISKGYGKADPEQGIPFTGRTVFPVGSITKQFTGAAILRLQSLGKVSTGDPITLYFRNVPKDKASITVEHLLTHSAGFPDALGFDYEKIERDAYIDLALRTPLEFEPGTGYGYSNVGYSLLAAILERRSGLSYDAFVRKHLFEPAGMTKTGYAKSLWAPEELARGYRGDEMWGSPVEKVWAEDGPYWHLRGNGAVMSTLEDMHRWHAELLGESVLTEAEKEAWYTPRVKEGAAPTWYGYGWVVSRSEERGLLIAHNGGNPYFSNDFLRYLDRGVMVYIVSSNGEMRAPRYAPVLADIAFGDPHELPPEEIETVAVVDLENSPVGRRARELLAALAAETGDLRAFAETAFAKRILERYSVEDLVEQLSRDRENLGAMEVARIIRTGQHRLEITARSVKHDEWWRLEITVEPEGEHRIVGLGVDSAMPPAGSKP